VSSRAERRRAGRERPPLPSRADGGTELELCWRVEPGCLECEVAFGRADVRETFVTLAGMLVLAEGTCREVLPCGCVMLGRPASDCTDHSQHS